MRNLKFTLALIIIVLSACSTGSGSTAPAPASESNSAPSQQAAVPSSPASESAPMPSPTAEPALIPPASIAPESFAKAKVLQEYGPTIRKELGLAEKIPFGTSLLDWALSPDGRYVAVAGCNGVVRTVDLNSMLPYDCQETALSMSVPAYFFMLDAKNGKIITRFPETGQALTITGLSFTNDSRKLVYEVSTHGPVEAWNEHYIFRIWDMESAQVEFTMEGDGTLGWDISPDDKWLSLDYADHVEIWDFALKKLVTKLPSSWYPFAVFSKDGRKLLLYNDPYLTVYDTNTWQPLSDQALMPQPSFQAYAVSPDFSLMAICRAHRDDRPIRIWDIATGTQVQTLKTKFGRCGPIQFSPDSKYLFLFNDQGAGPLIWPVDTWKLFNQDVYHEYYQPFFAHGDDGFVDRIEFSQDGKQLLVGTLARLTLYDLPGAAPGQEMTNSPTASAATAPPAARETQHCDIVVTGWVKLHADLCSSLKGGVAGNFTSTEQMMIELTDDDLRGVTIYVPVNMLPYLKPGKYPVGEYTTGPGMIADFRDQGFPYVSYSGKGMEIVITEVGATISGSFKFGARTLEEERQVNVEGTFENIPFVHVNVP
jgi:WD40 repeat protein